MHPTAIFLLAIVCYLGTLGEGRHRKSADSIGAGKNTPEAQAFLDKYLKTKNVTSDPTYLFLDIAYNLPIKNQNHPKSNGWAFAVTGALEYQKHLRDKLFKGNKLFKRKKRPITLSEQDLIDCSKISIASGRPDEALKFVAQRGGIMSESSYPRKNLFYRPESCDYSQSKSVLSASGVAYLPSNDPESLKRVLNLYGAVIVTMKVNRVKFNNYRHDGGIYEDEECHLSNSTQNFLLFGYGRMNYDKEINYWFLRNSMGRKWGKMGIMQLSMNTPCGILDEPVIPTFRDSDSDEPRISTLK